MNDRNDVPVKVGYALSLSGALGVNGRSARLAHEIWAEDVNERGGLLGRRVQLVCVDDETDRSKVAGIYTHLLDVEQVDLVVGGYGTNTIAPAMPLVIDRGRYFVGLMGLGVNADLQYPKYFVMIPTGPRPNSALTEGFFSLAAAQEPKPASVAILAADAEFSRNPIAGARENARTHGFEIVHERLYPLSTTDYEPIIRDLEAIGAEILLLCSYLDDSIGIVRAIAAGSYRPKMVGGAMIGPQTTPVKTALGPLLNGLVNYDYWLPLPSMMFSGVSELIDRYQTRATATGVDALGYYVAPLAYAQMQVVEQAVLAIGGVEDEALAAYTRAATFHTVVGDVRFGPGGEWAESRVLQVQFQSVKDHNVEEFRDASTQVVVAPDRFASGELVYPFFSPARLLQDADLRPTPGAAGLYRCNAR
jgi:branched-chain amino acid transport system substrate-binding protein